MKRFSNLKMKFILPIAVITITVIIDLAYQCDGTDMASSNAATPLGSTRALEIAQSFLQGQGNKISYQGIVNRKDFPPYSKCYLLKSCLSVEPGTNTLTIDDPTSPKGYKLKTVPAPPLNAQMWVEANTGRILEYKPDAGYTEEKNRKRPAIAKTSLITPEKTKKLGMQYVLHAGISLEGLRVINMWLETPHRDNNYYAWCINLARVKSIEGIGDIEYPENVLMILDAETGEIDRFHYKDFTVDIPVVPPVITKERAEEIARDNCNQENVESTETSLIIFPGTPPKYDTNAIAWRVTFWLKNMPRSTSERAVIDAQTGYVLECITSHTF